MHRVPRQQVLTVESPVPANVRLAFELLAQPKDGFADKLVEKANEVVFRFLEDNGLSQSIADANARSQMVAVHAAHMAPPPGPFPGEMPLPRQRRSLAETALDTFVSIMVGGGLTFTIAQIVDRQGPEILDAIEKMIEEIRIARAAADARDDSVSPQFPPLDDPATTPPFNSVQKTAGVGAPAGAEV